MYADTITPAMALAIEETNRRREKQIAYNTAHGIDPQPLRKKIADITDLIIKEDEDTRELTEEIEALTRSQNKRKKATASGVSIARTELIDLIESLSEQMRLAAESLNFELAARLRDEIRELKKELRGMEEAGV
jgi:excinuclease ABC subunit B